MEQYINKAAVMAEINRRIMDAPIDCYGHQRVWAYNDVKGLIDTLETKEVNEVPAEVQINSYGNKYISTWSGLNEYNNYQIGEQIKVLIPKR